MPVNNQIIPPERQAIADGLSQLLSATYLLFLETHSFHWNGSGPSCTALGLLLEEHSVDLASAVDAIAEQIRAHGFPALGSYSLYARLSSQKAPIGVLSDHEMIEQLLQRHEAVMRTARALLPKLNDANEPLTAEWVAQRMRLHEGIARTFRVMKRSFGAVLDIR